MSKPLIEIFSNNPSPVFLVQFLNENFHFPTVCSIPDSKTASSLLKNGVALEDIAELEDSLFVRKVSEDGW